MPPGLSTITRTESASVTVRHIFQYFFDNPLHLFVVQMVKFFFRLDAGTVLFCLILRLSPGSSAPFFLVFRNAWFTRPCSVRTRRAPDRRIRDVIRFIGDSLDVRYLFTCCRAPDYVFVPQGLSPLDYSLEAALSAGIPTVHTAIAIRPPVG